MTPQQWNEKFETVDAAVFKRIVARECRLHLSTLGDADYISTGGLVEVLYPHADASITVIGFSTRSALFKTIAVLAYNGLEDCCRKGEASGKKFMGRVVRPWLWFKSPMELCCMCGQTIPTEDI